jgi:hypothetical protein
LRKQSELIDSDNLELYQDDDDSDAEENSLECKFALYEHSSEHAPASTELKANKDVDLDEKVDQIEVGDDVKITDKQF